MIPAALAALHNFIRQYDPKEIHMFDDQLVDFQKGFCPESPGELEIDAVDPDEIAQADEKWDKIAGDMWEQYQQNIRDHAAHHG